MGSEVNTSEMKRKLPVSCLLLPNITVSRLLDDESNQTAFFRTGLALKRTVLPALTFTVSPVRGLSALRALVLWTVKVPKDGSVNPPLLLQFGDNGSDQVIGGLGGGNAGAVQRVLKNGGNEGFAHAGTGPCRDRFRKR